MEAEYLAGHFICLYGGRMFSRTGVSVFAVRTGHILEHLRYAAEVLAKRFSERTATVI
jgi:hypothetical protein